MSTNNKYLDRNGVRYLYHNIIKPYVDSADSTIKTDVQILSEKCAELEQRMIPITHHELVSLRDAGGLIPGMQYRITDYEFTTLNPRLKAKPSTFDIIVTADDDHTLNEDARAVARENVAANPSTRLYAVDNAGEYQGVVDTNDYFEYEDEVVIDGQTLYKWRKYEGGAATDYFVLTDTRTFVGITANNPYTPIGYGWTDANGQYPEGGSHRDKDVVPADGGMPEPRDYTAWELKYTIDNVLWSASKGQWIWTDDEMEFERVGTIEIGGVTWVLWYNKDFDAELGEGETKGYFATLGDIVENETMTSLVDVDGKRIVSEDYSSIMYYNRGDEDGKGTILWLKDEYRNSAHYDHHNALIKTYRVTACEGVPDVVGMYVVPDYMGNVAIDTDAVRWMPTFGKNCHDNSIGAYRGTLSPRFEKIALNVFYADCSYNILERGCYDNTFGVNCKYNTFWVGCSSNTFGSDCRSNAFGSDCSSNAFGRACRQNTFGSDCSSNAFGSDCSSNAFGRACRQNTFGSGCSYNTFGSNGYQNKFGSAAQDNNLGNSCGYNSIGSRCTSIVLQNSCSFAKISDNVKFATVINDVNPGNFTKINIPFASNKTYCQYAGYNSSGELKIWVPADLV